MFRRLPLVCVCGCVVCGCSNTIPYIVQHTKCCCVGCYLFLIAQVAVFAQGCPFETSHNSAMVSIRIAQVGVYAQGCGNKEGSKSFNSNTAQCPLSPHGSESPHPSSIKNLRKKHFKRRPHSVRRPASLRHIPYVLHSLVNAMIRVYA